MARGRGHLGEAFVIAEPESFGLMDTLVDLLIGSLNFRTPRGAS
jgi:hypothetical protein